MQIIMEYFVIFLIFFLLLVIIYPHSMDKPIRLIEFLLTVLAFVGILVAGWVNLNRESADQGARIKTLEGQFQKLDSKSDKIIDKLEVLTIIMANKQDRRDK